jgi:hypothetical protein
MTQRSPSALDTAIANARSVLEKQPTCSRIHFMWRKNRCNGIHTKEHEFASGVGVAWNEPAFRVGSDTFWLLCGKSNGLIRQGRWTCGVLQGVRLMCLGDEITDELVRQLDQFTDSLVAL